MVNEIRVSFKDERDIWLIPLDFPLNWNLKLKFSILPERPTPCIIKRQKWIRALRMGEKLIPVIVSAEGSIEKPKLIVTTPKISSKEKEKIVDFLFEFHGLKSVKELYDFMDGDEILKKIKEKLYGFGKAGLMSATVFEGIIKAIIQQQISLRNAELITANLVENYGERIEFCGEYAYEFPTPETLTGLSLKELRNCGLSWKKAEYIKGFSSEVINGFNPENLKDKNPEEIIETLTNFKGIGRWTAELVMVASIGMNVIPADDLGVRKAISHFYFKDKLQPAEKVREFAESKFGKYMSDCIVYLLMAYRQRM